MPYPKQTNQLYFAYGSNLSLEQMAHRCPDSRYIGRAILPDHAWQINERGYANVVPRSGSSVHGLVYAISAADEARLDRCEGVQTRLYSKTYHDAIFHPARSKFQLFTRDVVHRGGVVRAMGRKFKRSRHFEQSARLQRDMLVYISREYVRQSEPRSEYVDRINKGIKDATSLGVPMDYYEEHVRHIVPGRRSHRVRTPSPFAQQYANAYCPNNHDVLEDRGYGNTHRVRRMESRDAQGHAQQMRYPWWNPTRWAYPVRVFYERPSNFREW
ncbi:hypothetical protein C8034_v005572 [Colletotrichum sidae]|uniref:gamma-glutamylcyclotransferase n=1 Tax=Colletotrichum sidae TaxID=1347389 RepID=A0A4R8T676_9PEZI|nr:hypothetical protein C8034_v005572 [Colletotrichum sidae]